MWSITWSAFCFHNVFPIPKTYKDLRQAPNEDSILTISFLKTNLVQLIKCAIIQESTLYFLISYTAKDSYKYKRRGKDNRIFDQAFIVFNVLFEKDTLKV